MFFELFALCAIELQLAGITTELLYHSVDFEDMNAKLVWIFVENVTFFASTYVHQIVVCVFFEMSS